MYEYYYAFVEFIGGQYQDGLMVSCPVEETNEMEFVEIRLDDNFETSKYFVRLQADLKKAFSSKYQKYPTNWHGKHIIKLRSTLELVA